MNYFGGVEILMHNVSHADLVMSINDNSGEIKTDDVIARPKFSAYRSISESVLLTLKSKQDDVEFAHYPVYIRQEKNRFPIKESQENFTLPVGFNFKQNIISSNSSQFRFRRDDKAQLKGDCFIEAVYFPLLAVLVATC